MVFEEWPETRSEYLVPSEEVDEGRRVDQNGCTLREIAEPVTVPFVRQTFEPCGHCHFPKARDHWHRASISRANGRADLCIRRDVYVRADSGKCQEQSQRRILSRIGSRTFWSSAFEASVLAVATSSSLAGFAPMTCSIIIVMRAAVVHTNQSEYRCCRCCSSVNRFTAV
jgi:hypothetical protein